MSSHRKPKTVNPDEIDPSVYYYDEVYDDMQHAQEKEAETLKKTRHKEGSKYIQGIIETAERRKSEKEIRKFKKFARDREEAQASGDLEDTDVYVTKSYEKKLREMQDAMKKHSERDDDRTLNSFKRTLADGDQKESPRKRDVTETPTNAECPSPKTTSGQPKADLDQCAPKKDADGPNPLSEIKTEVKRPKTIEERREYLRQVLAKRTVGDVFKAAQERYRLRKSKAG